MNVLSFSMPDFFEHMLPGGDSYAEWRATSLAGNLDPHHRVAVADLIPYYNVRIIWIRKELMAAATLTSKGQITIPVEVRNTLGLEAGDRIEFVQLKKDQYAIMPATRSVRELNGMFYDKRRKAVSIEEMNTTIARRASGLP